MDEDDSDNATLSLIDCGIKSLGSLNLPTRLASLNLHSNSLTRIEHLSHLHSLTHLDLSSNQIEKISGLDTLISLHSLNLACNRLVSVDSLSGLRRLVHLNLSYNMIRSIHGLGDLWGDGYSLETLSIAYNYLKSLDECVYYLSGLVKLKHLSLAHNEIVVDYRTVLFGKMKSLLSIDDKDRLNRVVRNSVYTCSAHCKFAPQDIKFKIEPESVKHIKQDENVSVGPKLDLIEEKIHQLLLIRDKIKSCNQTETSRIHLRDRSNELMTTAKPKGGILKPTLQQSESETSVSSSSQSSEIDRLSEALKKLENQLAVHQQTQEANLKTIDELKSNLEKCYSDQAKAMKEKDDIASKNNEVGYT